MPVFTLRELANFLCQRAVIAIALIAASVIDANALVPNRALTLDQRVESQLAIDRVYYAHQTGATRPFDEVMPRSAVENKVRTYLKQSLALEQVWSTAITAEALHAEIERMARETRSPERLRELFAAVGNDPFLVQECIARPALVSRLTLSFFAHDETIQSAAREAAEALHEDLESGNLAVVDPHPLHYRWN